jgi:hypothetical protein
LGEHVGHQVHRYPGPLEDGCPAHNIRIADHHFFDARELLQLVLHFVAGGLDFDSKRRPISHGQSIRLRRLPDQFRNLPPRPDG